MKHLAALLMLCALSCLGADELRGKVVGVHDGDTITVLVVKTEHKVRLWGIDAPESKQAFGAKSKASLSALVIGKTVRVEVRDKDQYGRDLGIVYLAKLNANLSQVANGWAWWFEKYAPHADEAGAPLRGRLLGGSRLIIWQSQGGMGCPDALPRRAAIHTIKTRLENTGKRPQHSRKC